MRSMTLVTVFKSLVSSFKPVLILLAVDGGGSPLLQYLGSGLFQARVKLASRTRECRSV